MKEKCQKYIGAILAGAIFVLIILAVIFMVSIFGGSVMKIFGFQYESIGSIVLYFLITMIISFPIELIVTSLSKALLTLDKITLNYARFLFVILDISTSFIMMKIVDYYMTSVSATHISIFVLCLIFSFISVQDIKANQEI